MRPKSASTNLTASACIIAIPWLTMITRGRMVGKRHGITFVDMLKLALFVFLFLVFLSSSLETMMESINQEEAMGEEASIKGMVFSKKNTTSNNIARKLMQFTDYGDGNRSGMGCSTNDIAIFQGSTAPLPNGIPSYSVEIANVCVDSGSGLGSGLGFGSASGSGSSCSISNIHVSCGWFSSVNLINPTVFRRLNYDDCLVNDGKPLQPGQCLSFQYANSFSYPLSVSSVAC